MGLVLVEGLGMSTHIGGRDEYWLWRVRDEYSYWWKGWVLVMKGKGWVFILVEGMSIGYEGLGMSMHIGGKRLLDSDNFLLLSCTVLSILRKLNYLPEKY